MLADCSAGESWSNAASILLRSRRSALGLRCRIARRACRNPWTVKPGAGARCGHGSRSVVERPEPAAGTIGAQYSACSLALRWPSGMALRCRHPGVSAPAPARRQGSVLTVLTGAVSSGRKRNSKRESAATSVPCRSGWLDGGDQPGPRSERGTIERNAIALLSGYREPAPDPSSANWLGQATETAFAAPASGTTTMMKHYAPTFLDAMERRIGG